MPGAIEERRGNGGRSVILLYHRVAEAATDPFELAVSPQWFGEHLEVLRGFGRPLALSELARRIEAGTLAEVSFAVTFDDGYADNLHAAKPILERCDVPASVFVATGCIGGPPFWWDELAELVLGAERLPERIELELEGIARSWEVSSATPDRVFHELWELLQSLEDASRRRALAAVRSQLDGASVQAGRSLTPDELVELAADGIIDIGAHSKTHPILARLEEREAREEILGSRAWLEDVLSRSVPAFSYPYGGPGHYGEAAVEIVREGGFEAACSAVPALATAGSDVLQLPRVTVGKWDGEELERRLAELLDSGGKRTADGRRASASKADPAKAGGIDLGDLRRLEPLSRHWGFDRGTPIDRYYIERFLEARREAIRGRVLEVGEPLYTKMFGGDRVSRSVVLDVSEGPGIDYVCRLEDGDELPAAGFDCALCTQTLQFIYDFRGALRTLHRILKPGGTLLATVPGITRVSREEYPDSWYWSFTAASMRNLATELFSPDAVEVEPFGNVLAASAFLYGLADSELSRSELDHLDPDYEVIIGVRAVR